MVNIYRFWSKISFFTKNTVLGLGLLKVKNRKFVICLVNAAQKKVRRIKQAHLYKNKRPKICVFQDSEYSTDSTAATKHSEWHNVINIRHHRLPLKVYALVSEWRSYRHFWMFVKRLSPNLSPTDHATVQ